MNDIYTNFVGAVAGQDPENCFVAGMVLALVSLSEAYVTVKIFNVCLDLAKRFAKRLYHRYKNRH